MYKGSYRCRDCNHNFSRITKAFPKKDPNCPKCKKSNRLRSEGIVSDKTHQLDDNKKIQDMIDSRQAPSAGKSNFTKAMDATAEIVMKDYNLTDLQDNLRAGDSMAPKLAPELERQVDNVFKPQKPIMGQTAAGGLNKALTNQINSGRYASQSGGADIVQKAQNSGYKVPTTELFSYDNRGKPN